MKHKIIYLFMLLTFSITVFSQSVGINTAKPNAKSGLHISERKDPANASPDVYNGLIIQRYTAAERDANFSPTTTEDGLTIYNTTEKCYNYYQSANAKWMSLCGTYSKAVYTTNCSNIKIFGTYTQGTSLNTSNYITIPVTVTEAGTYSIIAKTTNGYYFQKSGVFPNTGTFNVTLEGSGIPVNGPQTNTLTFEYDGTEDTTCNTKTVNVLGSQVSYSINCSNPTIAGDYNKGIDLDYNTNTVTISLSNVDTGGTVTFSTSTNNGVNFAASDVISTNSTSITLHGLGTPTSAGTYTYTFTTNGANPQACTFSVTFGTTIGNFDNPANRCLEIFNDGRRTDGYYWVKDSSGNKSKTYCDMTSGGWTLIKSISERGILVTDRTQDESWATQRVRNEITTETGIFNEYYFSLSSAKVNNIGNSGLGAKQYRMTIKEKGHTGTTLAEVESTTISPSTDYWGKDNYYNAVVTTGNLATGNFAGNTYTATGKVFGFTFEKPVTGGTSYLYNGAPFAATPPGLYSQANFYTGFYGGNGYAGANTPANNLTYTYPAGQTYIFNKYYVNDMFGLYMNSEQQANHHIGTCSNSTDDYGGASFCNAGWANWRPHNFNLRSGNYEGRILQYWVK